jgi:hypothetical protein
MVQIVPGSFLKSVCFPALYSSALCCTGVRYAAEYLEINTVKYLS